MTRRLAILIPDLFGGGAERTTSHLTRALDPSIATELVLFEDRIEYPYRGELHVMSDALSREISARAQLVNLARIAARFHAFRRARRPDTVLSLMPYANFVNVLTKARGQRVVLSTRNTESRDNPGLVGAATQWLIRALYDQADCVVALSEAVRAELIERYGVAPERVVRIYNPIPLEQLRADGEAALDDDLAPLFDGPLVLAVGRLSRQKGHRALLRAFTRARATIPEAKLLILGRGKLAEPLRRLAREDGHRVFSVFEDGAPDGPLEACDVVFGGFRANPARFVARADVFAFPSIYEGLGMALLEAVCLGAVAVAADCRHGPREILAPDTDWRREAREPEDAAHGILMPVPPADLTPSSEPLGDAERAWADTLVRVLSDADLRARYRERALARGRDFDLDAIIPQWEAALFPVNDA